MRCHKCNKNNVPIEAVGFFCEECSKIKHEAYMNRTFEETCFQCNQKGNIVEAVWEAYGWAVTFGMPQTSHHCEEHEPVELGKIQPENQGHGFWKKRIENNQRKVVA